MKSIKLFMLFFFFQGMISDIYSQNNEIVSISGKLINVENIDAVYLKYHDNIDTVFVNNNIFEANLNIAQPQYLYFIAGLDNYTVFIFPGDIVNIEFERIKNFEFKITFKTNNPVYTEYFNFVNNTSVLLNKDTNSLKGGIEFLYHKIDTLYKINADYYNNLISTNPNLNEKFIYLEPFRLYLSNKSRSISLSSLSLYNPDNDKHLYNDSILKSVSQEINLNDEKLMQLEEYKSLAIVHYSKIMGSFSYSKVKIENNDDDKALAFDLSMLETFKSIDAGFGNIEFKDYLKYLFLGTYLPYLDKVMLDSTFIYFLQTCKNQKYIDNLKSYETNRKESLTGKKAPDFSCEDINGKKYSLSDFKGKYIFIDFWATWCRPCREETPGMKALFGKYKDNKNIVIISLSIDKNKEEWKKVIKDESMNWIQLHTSPDSKILEEYQVDGIPKFVLIDKEGKIINPDSPRPSDNNLIKLLDKYLMK
jgi:peroxiredoxin